jgi:inhibitor of cysteine peptidase
VRPTSAKPLTSRRRAGLGLAKIAIMIVFASLVGVNSAIASQRLMLDEKDDGTTSTVRAGDTLIVSLRSNASTGYTWRIAQNDQEHLRPLGEAYDQPTHAMPGAPGRQVFRFQARSPGRSTLRLDYVRPWEKNTPPAETFSIAVTIE